MSRYFKQKYSVRSENRSVVGPLLLIGGGIATTVAIIFAQRKSSATTQSIVEAVNGPSVKPGQYPEVNIRATGYWPFTARDDEKKMEGGTKDRKGNPLHTVEDFLAGKADFVSLSGDDAVWPYGQKLLIPWVGGKTIVGRVVDTGSHFRGAGKIYRVVGYEPIDVCVESSKSEVPKKITAQIVPGDSFDKKKDVVVSKLKDQSVSLAGDEGRNVTPADVEALARALESELGGRSREEMLAAGWAIRNRAAKAHVSVSKLLAPKGEFGPAAKTGGFASTRRASTERSREAAEAVLKSSDDVSGEAVDFWVPSQQVKMRQFGDLYRAAVKSGNVEQAKKYARYANYGTEGDVRVQQARDGLRTTKIVGVVELLGKV